MLVDYVIVLFINFAQVVFSREVPDGGSVYQLQQMLAKAYKVTL